MGEESEKGMPEKGIAELFTELMKRMASLENEVASLRSQYYSVLRESDIDKIAMRVEQSLVRKIGTELRQR